VIPLRNRDVFGHSKWRGVASLLQDRCPERACGWRRDVVAVTGFRAEVDVPGVFARYRLHLVHLAVLLVDDLSAAEDVVQDAFLGLHRHAAQVRDPDAAVAYLRRATVNGARSQLRRRATARRHLRPAGPTMSPAADEAALLSEEHQRVLRAVRALGPRDQEVLALRYWSGLSDTEISAALKISRSAVASTASRALAKLKGQLEEQS
jgi:RNA polymerase sigma factor (sigma-70 family)